MPDPQTLTERLAKQIAGSGAISITEYMRLSNAEYYEKSDPLGSDGDFVTAPEVSQMFGELAGLWFADLWLRQNSPSQINYVELGPGRGTLAADALRAMSKFYLNPSVHFVETSSVLRGKQEVSVPGAYYYNQLDELPDEGPLFVMANEFFDALPVRQFVVTPDGWRERFITYAGGDSFQPVAGEQPCDQMVPDDIRGAPEGSIFESTPDTSDAIYELSARLERQGGAMLIVDYGYAQPGLGSTLQAVKTHKYANPFAGPGGRDLTAHVNFLEISNLARLRGLRVNGPAEQGLWLSALGINQRTEALIQKMPDRAEDIVAARNRLVKPEEMGSLFKVLALSASEWGEPEGFADAIT